MIDFKWNNLNLDITDIGGGLLKETIPRHAHSKNSYELHFITSGECDVILDDNTYHMGPNDFFLTGAGIYHKQVPCDNGVEDIFIMIQSLGNDKANALSAVFINNAFCLLHNFDLAIPRAILQEYKNKLPDYNSAISGLTMKLLTDIVRLLLPDNFIGEIAAGGLNDRRFIIIEQAFLYTPELTLKKLSDKIGVCERQTQRLLKKYYGKSFREKKAEGKQKTKI